MPVPTSLASRAGADTIPIVPVKKGRLRDFLKDKPAGLKAWLESVGFTAEPGSVALVPGRDHRLRQVLVGVESPGHIWAYGDLPTKLPAKHRYRLEARLEAAEANNAALGWALGSYAYTRYKSAKRKPATLVWPEAADRVLVEARAEALCLARDLINTPADDMGPSALASAAGELAKQHGAKIEVIVGDQLLKRNYPTIHAVGRAAADAPRLIDMSWGKPSAPKVTLVGKGVCFDSGGLDIKTAAGMKMMKKDMGGAASVLALAKMIMAEALPLRLRVLVPAVENAISANAFHPLDVIRTRKGITVEVGNTDAEGRLILCDALAEADSEKPTLLIDMATLTGAARVALGPELPALFSNNDSVAADLLTHAQAEADPLWRMPLWQPYRKMLETYMADISSTGDAPFAGSVTAALFLQSFVSKDTPWVHIDTYAWNAKTRPGRPEGGEALGARALLALIRQRYARV
ncbi:MAG: leucyl aminopeptidase family protein [Proteobacteria bacterium]|nr:leucyl aminopeptidase family protein [Pseudomonadota bacterium]MBI3500030.1 leucyl aminopeptidase family protein [Pseudomonadota bacterium]